MFPDFLRAVRPSFTDKNIKIFLNYVYQRMEIEGRTKYYIAREMGKSPSSVERWMEKFEYLNFVKSKKKPVTIKTQPLKAKIPASIPGRDVKNLASKVNPVKKEIPMKVKFPSAKSIEKTPEPTEPVFTPEDLRIASNLVNQEICGSGEGCCGKHIVPDELKNYDPLDEAIRFALEKGDNFIAECLIEYRLMKKIFI